MNKLNPLAQKKCQPCEGAGSILDSRSVEQFLRQVPGWQLQDSGNGISRLYVTKNFMAAVDFIGKIARVAESEDHHPDIHLTGYRNLRVD